MTTCVWSPVKCGSDWSCGASPLQFGQSTPTGRKGSKSGKSWSWVLYGICPSNDPSMQWVIWCRVSTVLNGTHHSSWISSTFQSFSTAIQDENSSYSDPPSTLDAWLRWKVLATNGANMPLQTSSWNKLVLLGYSSKQRGNQGRSMNKFLPTIIN